LRGQTVLAMLVILMAGFTAHASSITNGTFDSPSGWTSGPSECGQPGGQWNPGLGDPGGAMVLNQCGSASINPEIYQTVTGLTVGDTYQLDWDYHLYDNGNTTLLDTFGVFLNAGSSAPSDSSTPIFLGSITNGDTYNNLSPSTWVHGLTTFVATQDTNTIMFAGELDQRTPGVPQRSDVSYIIDNIALSDQGAAVPEPSVLLLFGTGLVGLSQRLRKRAR